MYHSGLMKGIKPGGDFLHVSEKNLHFKKTTFMASNRCCCFLGE